MSLAPALVHFESLGSLLEWISEEAVRRAASNVGFVSDAKVEAQGFASSKIGRARVTLDHSSPLFSLLDVVLRKKGQRKY